MKVSIEIASIYPDNLIKELEDILSQVKNELKDPICVGCKTCKDRRKGCYVGGGSSEYGLESDWKLKRQFDEHKTICKSSNKR